MTRAPARIWPALSAASTRVLRGALVLLVATLPLPGSAAAARLAASASGPSAPQGAPFIQGKLIIAKQGDPSVLTPEGAVAVTSDDPSVRLTLQDSRLSGREVRLLGKRNASGAFEAEHVLTVHDGKLFRLRFYCHICNIAATEPGPCVCCQRPTDLEEIPADQVTDDMVMVP